MRLAHRTTILTLLALGSAWGLCLVLAGLHAMNLAFRADALDPVLISLGVAGVAAGNFVFMEVVADRILPASGRRLRDLAEIAAAGLMVFALAAAGAIWFGRTLP